ncbi:phosphoenolpyruvate--protein phosphotransferase [Sphingomonas sp. PB2P12]|uniref:phosphoenolpyruvate--protein phosphotransferase n=1 Tax=Sphingomonas sandaracina TaxID=3096157 RepID=UPI002FCC6945
MQITSDAGPVETELVRLGAAPADKAAAIAEVGAMLVAAGCVGASFADSMARREAVSNTYLGAGLAIPHGMGEDKGLIRRDGIAVLQVPAGVEWNPGQIVHLVVGIAASSDSHIAILRRLTRLIQQETRLAPLFTTTDAAVITAALSGEIAPAPTAVASDLDQRIEWTIAYPAGLHVRPATRLVEAAKAAGVPIRIRHGDEMADATKLVALLQLGLKQGDVITISTTGAGAQDALAKFRAVAESMVAQEKADAERAAEKASAPVRGWTPESALQTFVGVSASPGMAIGTVHVIASEALDIPDIPEPLLDAGERLERALARTRDQLAVLVDDTTRRLGAGDAAIFKGQATLLDDTDLITLTCQLVVEQHGIAWSWNTAIERLASRLAALGNPMLAGRAADLRDVGRRVLAELDPALRATFGADDLPDGPVVVVATDLSPSDTAGLDPARVVGIATALGGPTSHSAILARTLGLPAVVAGGAGLLAVARGTTVIVDGDTGRLYLDPTPADLDAARAWIAEGVRIRTEEEAQRGLPATTTDGTALAIAANVNRADQVSFALSQGAEGVGLMRTEFLFLERSDSPTEDEQYAAYRAMVDALGDRPLIVRALDIGGDKQVAYLDLPKEDNPFLGVRGARLLMRRIDLLEPQLRALYRAARDGGDLSIMFPMISSVSELVSLRATCEAIRVALDAPVVPIGIMIEVPAAAILAEALAEHADFFSIGTNDLTQYGLAMDRQNPDLAAEADAFHPAILRLIQMTVAGARRYDRWVGVCGGLAGDPLGAALLAGLGITELSMTPRDIPAVKARLRGSDMAALQKLADRALALSSPADVRALGADVASEAA